MRKYFLVLLFMSLINCVLAQNVDEAIKYNDAIIDKNNEVITAFEALMESYAKFDPKEMDKAYNDALLKVQDAIIFVKKLTAFKSDASFRDGALDLFKVYKSFLDVEHKRIIELLKLPDTRYGEKEVAEYEELINKINEKNEQEMNKLIQIQNDFAKKHHFDISN
ncbi:MAG: hypothetical protein P1P88_03810 [Bacteroidales bacterium]|nr:hypothetical protein [Bacteroidales bacterium]